MSRALFFFLQLRPGLSAVEIRKMLAPLGRARVSGVGTETDPEALWFEVASAHCQDIARARELLEPLSAYVELIQMVDRGEGKLLARQIPLFKGVP